MSFVISFIENGKAWPPPVRTSTVPLLLWIQSVLRLSAGQEQVLRVSS